MLKVDNYLKIILAKLIYLFIFRCTNTIFQVLLCEVISYNYSKGKRKFFLILKKEIIS